MNKPPEVGTAGIALDNWKLDIFKAHLDKAGYEYEEAGQLTEGTTILKVPYEDLLALQAVVITAYVECRRKKAH